MNWPLAQDYSEAIQNPTTCFRDPELMKGTPVLNHQRLPVVSSGNFASVFQIQSGGSRFAVKCFTSLIPDRASRYNAISTCLRNNPLPFAVKFEYAEQGIRCGGRWFPILKMEWVDGISLDKFVNNHVNDNNALSELAQKFIQLTRLLNKHGIAHGDLQHGNMLVVGKDLKLVDYDGMYVPALCGRFATELGQRNYQHPLRTPSDFGPNLDHFSAWVIYLSIMSLVLDPSLWHRIDNCGDDNLILRREDFCDPANSRALRLMNEAFKNNSIDISIFFRLCELDSIRLIPAIQELVSRNASGLKSTSATTDDLVQADDTIHFSSLAASDWEHEPVGSSWILDHVDGPARRTIEGIRVHERFACACLAASVIAAIYFLASDSKNSVSYAASSFSVAVISVAGLVGMYTHRADVVRKKLMLSERKQKREDWARAKEELDKQLSNWGFLSENEKQEYTRAMAEKASVELKERKAVEKSEGERKGELAEIQSKRLKIQENENKALANALKTTQDKFIYLRLSAHKICDEHIEGLGIQLKNRLASHGILSAADFIQVYRVSTGYGRFAQSTANIRTSKGIDVHIEGIGQVKGAELQAWRTLLYNRYQQRMPTKIPAEEQKAIRAPFQHHLNLLDKQEKDVETKFHKLVTELHSRSHTECEGILNNLAASRKKIADLRKELDGNIKKRKSIVSGLELEVAKLQKNIDAFAAVNFASYVKSIMFVFRQG